MKWPLCLSVAGPSARPHSLALGGAAGIVVLQVGLQLLRPWPLAIAVDYALGGKSVTGRLEFLAGIEPAELLILAAVATVFLTTVNGLLDMVSLRLAEGAAERIGADLRATMFERTMTRSLRWHDRMRSGELLSRLTTDVGRVLDGVIAIATSFLPDAVMLVSVLVLLLAFDPGLLLIGLLVIPLLAALAVRQRARIRAVQQDARAESGRMAGATTDLLRNVRAVQAFARTDHAMAAYGERNQSVLDVELRAIRVDARWTPMADVLLSIGSALVLVVGGLQVLDGAMSVGELLVVTAYLRDLYSPVRGLTRLSAVLAKAGASATRVQDVLECDEAVTDKPGAWTAPALTQDVRFEKVGFRYEPEQPVLDDFNLRIAAGETVCLIGPSGIGKSTVLHLLLRLYEVNTGRVLIDGVNVRYCDQRTVRNRFAYVPQDPWLLDATVAENIAFGNPAATRADVLEAGRTAQVDEFIGRLPQGYDTSLGESGVRLSGGQRRRIAIARAAVSTAPMLLLDEPTASLDPRSAAAVVEAIRFATSHRTVLLVTHDRGLAAIADRVVTLARPSADRPIKISTSKEGG
ncbi:MAG TPA: ABC transporter ATP-binding protein [Kribbella sp.]|uniref:ABC transporter ATP-binding protein n=1 Tax=Kribbella sp. TaxID=1871183 RepID=UPI002D774046|nr:ABC transporter ATP-binding protein [Kribbella sp.]HET6296574.1 ABC transporter ATP-binding protein [Kribbella sp.]